MKKLLTMLFLTIITLEAGAEIRRIGPGEDPQRKLAMLQPGDELVLEGGVYSNRWVISGLKGTPDSPIVIRGSRGVVFRPTKERDGMLFFGGGGSRHVILKNIAFSDAKRAGLILNHCTNMLVTNCVFGGNGKWGIQTILSSRIEVVDCDIFRSEREHGIYFSTTDYPVVKACSIHHNAACGIHLNGDAGEGGDGMITGAVIEDNVIYMNGKKGGAAVNMDGVEKSLIKGNVVSNNYAGGIVSFHQDGAKTGSGNSFIGNTVTFERGRGRFGLAVYGECQGIVIQGNKLEGGRGPALDVGEECGT
jgi:nitrous oxidase accessory protein NosD